MRHLPRDGEQENFDTPRQKAFPRKVLYRPVGIEALLALPTIDKECLTLGDIGATAMRALVDDALQADGEG